MIVIQVQHYSIYTLDFHLKLGFEVLEVEGIFKQIIQIKLLVILLTPLNTVVVLL